jgi:hypothetical protein
MDREEESPPTPLPGLQEGVIHIHILVDCDDDLFVTTVSYEDVEDWSEYIKEKNEGK